jgi:Domain of unknown function (DUF4362)
MAIGCSQQKETNPPKKPPSTETHTQEEFTPTATDIVVKHTSTENLDRLKEFIQNVNNKKKDEVRVVAYTKEGDPIIEDLTFDGKELKVTTDTTRDKFGQPTITTRTCSSISTQKNNAGDLQYVANGYTGMESPLFLALDN